MTVAPNSLEARDVAYYFHPATNARRHEEIGPLVMESGRGVFVTDDQGKAYIEGLAGLWSVAVGFGEPRLVEAATRQMAKLPFYHSFGGKSHPQAIALAERLVKLAGGRLAKAQFTSSGSEANDFVVKLVWYYNNALGRTKKKTIVSRDRGYHGVTVASASLTGMPNFHRDFDLPLPGFRRLTAPHFWRNARPGETEEDFSERLAQEFEELVRDAGADAIAAFVAEPVMGAGGIVPPPAGYWPRMQAICRKNDILLVADEVITGFGRTGALFASHKYGIEPDVMVLSKALTSSYFPLSAVLVSDPIYQAVADNSAKIGTFAHGFTASGHPVGTAVAMENIDIIEERDLVGRANALAPHFQRRLGEFVGHPLVGEARGAGLIGALEFVADKSTKAPFDPPGVFAMRLAELCQDEGLIIRPIGETIAFCPPLIISEAEIDEMFARFGRALKRI